MSNWLWTGYKRPWLFVNCILCEINNRKDYSFTLIAKYFLLQALNCDVHSASEPTATRRTFEPTFGNVTRAFASPAPTAQERSRGTTRSGVTFSASIEICPEGFQQSLIRLAWCRIRFAASQLQLRQSSRIKKRHAVLRRTTTTSERCPLNPESKKNNSSKGIFSSEFTVWLLLLLLLWYQKDTKLGSLILFFKPLFLQITHIVDHEFVQLGGQMAQPLIWF